MGKANGNTPALMDISATLRWLVSRQVGYSKDANEDEAEPNQEQLQHIKLAGVYEDQPLFSGSSIGQEQFVGFNGRCNKRVDTCYAFWVTASLDVSTGRVWGGCLS